MEINLEEKFIGNKFTGKHLQVKIANKLERSMTFRNKILVKYLPS